MSSRSRQPRPRPRPADSPRPVFADETVVLAYIHPGQVSGYFMESLLQSVLFDIATGPRRIANVMQEWSSANVSAPRNAVTRRFLDYRFRDEQGRARAADWLLWVDADMQWGHDAVDQLLAAADPVARPIVGGLCFGRAEGGRLYPTIYHFVRMEDGRVSTARVRDYPRDQLVPVSATGAAFVLIHRTVLETIRDRGFNATFPWFQETELDGQPVGEDLTFCIRAGIAGFPVHVHTGVRIGHHKSALLTEEAFMAEQPPAPAQPGPEPTQTTVRDVRDGDHAHSSEKE